MYQNLAGNRTVTGNLIYNPSALLFFSIEYMRVNAFSVLAAPATTNVICRNAGELTGSMVRRRGSGVRSCLCANSNR